MLRRRWGVHAPALESKRLYHNGAYEDLEGYRERWEEVQRKIRKGTQFRSAAGNNDEPYVPDDGQSLNNRETVECHQCATLCSARARGSPQQRDQQEDTPNCGCGKPIWDGKIPGQTTACVRPQYLAACQYAYALKKR